MAFALERRACAIGVDRLIGWYQGEPLRFRQTADLPASIPYYGQASLFDIVGGVVMSVDAEVSPALYAPTARQGSSLSAEPPTVCTFASGQIPHFDLVSCNSDSRDKSVGMGRVRSLGEPSNARENLVGGFGPHEGLGVLVMALEKRPDRTFQFSDTAMYAASDLLCRQ